MRERLIQLAEFSLAAVITAVLLGSLYYLADRAKNSHDGSRAEAAARGVPPASTVPESAVHQPQDPVEVLTMEELRAKCVEEVRRNDPRPLGANSYCQQFATLSRRFAPPPEAATSSPRFSAAPQSSPEPEPVQRERQYAVYVNDCKTWGYGSIAYRQCRAREAKRLPDECTKYRGKLNTAAYDRSEDVREWMRAYCREADAYRVVD